MAVTHFNDVPVCGQVAKKNPLQTTGNVDDVTCKKCLKVLANMDAELSKSKNVQEPVEKKIVSDNPKVEAAIEKDFKEAEDQLNAEKKTKLDMKKVSESEKMAELEKIVDVENDADTEAEAELDAIIDSFTDDE